VAAPVCGASPLRVCANKYPSAASRSVRAGRWRIRVPMRDAGTQIEYMSGRALIPLSLPLYALVNVRRKGSADTAHFFLESRSCLMIFFLSQWNFLHSRDGTRKLVVFIRLVVRFILKTRELFVTTAKSNCF
jgi:hypothetical protein